MANNAERDQEISDLKSHIAALEQQAAMLEQRLRALEPKPAPAPAHRPVSIQYTAPPPPSGMPTDQELQQLLAKVRERHPRFRPPAGTSEQALQEDFAAFRVAFRWLISIARTPEPNHKYDYDELCSRCYRFSQRISAGVPPMNFGPIMCAAVATGDIVHDDPATLYPHCALGINPDIQFSGYAGVYKQILSGERDFLVPIASPKTRGPVSISFR